MVASALRGGTLALGGICVLATAALAQEPRGLLHRFKESATYVLEGSVSYFPQTFLSTPARLPDDREGVFWTKAALKSQVFLNDSLAFKVNAYAAYSSPYNELRGILPSPDTEKPYAPHFHFKELSVRYDAASFSVTAGRAPMNVGLCTLYSPADRYRVVNAANPMKLDDLGAWQVSTDVFVGENSLRLTVLPFEERSPAPHGRSRWLGDVETGFVQASTGLGTGLTGGATGLTVPAGGSARTIFRNRPGILVRWSGVLPGWDYFGAVHHGPSNFPVLQHLSPHQFSAENPSAWTGSAGFSTTRGRWEFHGDGLYQVTDDEQDQDFLKYCLGATYRETALASRLGLEEIVPTVEYAGEWVTDEQDSPGFVVDSSKARPLRNSILYKTDLRPNDKVTFILAGILNLTGDDHADAIGIEYRPNDNLTWKAGYVQFHGRSGTPFGRWNKNDHFELGLVRRF